MTEVNKSGYIIDYPISENFTAIMNNPKKVFN